VTQSDRFLSGQTKDEVTQSCKIPKTTKQDKTQKQRKDKIPRQLITPEDSTPLYKFKASSTIQGRADSE